MTTKKVYSTGRFGSRYGVGIRKRVIKVEAQQKKKKKCPECNLGTLKRRAAGIYFCSKCKKEFAGGAYVPETMTGSLIKKMVSQKKFSSEIKEEEQEETEIKIKAKPAKKEEKKTEKKNLIKKAKSVLGIDKKNKEEQNSKEEKK